MRVMLEVLQDEVRPVDAPLEEPVIPHLQLEAARPRRRPRPSPRSPAPPATRLSHPPGSPDPAQARTTHAGPDPGQARIAASAGPWQPGGRCHGPAYAQAAWPGRHRRRANGFQL